MGLFVLQCKHREGDSSNPENLIESPSAFSNYRLPFFMGYPYLENRTSQRVVLGHKLCADIDFPAQETWTIFDIRFSGWPELATFWPKVAKIKSPCQRLHLGF